MSALAHLAWRSLAERKGRAALTLVGLVLGVALFTAALVTAASGSAMARQVTRDGMGSADVMVTAVGGADEGLSGFTIATFPASVAHQVASVDGTDAVAEILTFPSALTTPGGATTEIRLNAPPPVVITGVRKEAARDVLGVEVAEGRLPRTSDEIGVSAVQAKRMDLQLGDEITFDTPTGRRSAKVTALTAAEGAGRISTLAFADLAAAQEWAGRPDELSMLAVQLVPGAKADKWTTSAEEASGPAVDMQTLDEVLSSVQAIITTFTGALTALAASVVFLGGFLLYLTMSMAVIERTRVYGLLSALGATARQIRRLVVLESLLLGIAAAIVGVPFGVVLASVIREVTGRLLEQLGGAESGLVVPWWTLTLGAAAGVVATVAAAAVPARRAASLDPVEAIRTGATAEPELSARAAAVGVIALAGGAALLVLSPTMTGLGAGMLATLVGAVVITPVLLRPLAAIVGRLTGRLAPGTAEVAVQHLATQRTRSGYTLALVMLVMALSIATGATHISFVTSLDRQIDREFGNDLVVEAATTLQPELVAALRTVPGVRAITLIGRGNTLAVAGDRRIPVNVEVIDPDTYFDVASFAWIDGNDTEARAALRAGSTVIVPAGLASALGAIKGETIALRTRQGLKHFEVAATVEVTNIPPTVAMSAADAARFVGVDTIERAQVDLAQGHAPHEVRAEILSELGDLQTFIVSTGSELKADGRAQVASALNGVFVLLALAALVGIAGLANTMAMSILQRNREIGVLRAIGARARHLRLMVMAESTTLVVAALILAVPLGLALSGPLLAGVRRGLGDTTVPYAFPWSVFPIIAIAGLAAAAIASFLPAQRAVRLDIDVILREE